MMDIVFSDSACGSLKMAQHYGEGPYQTGAFIGIGRSGGSKPTEAEIETARQVFEKKERLAWENARPMGGSPADVFGFNLGLSVGDISENSPGAQRQKVLNWLFSIYPHREGEPAAHELFHRAQTTLGTVRGRAKSGEALRLWYSHWPDELCGLYWFLSQIEDLCQSDIQISVVLLPEWDATDDGKAVQYTSWGELHPGDWHRFLSYEKAVPAAFFQNYTARWRQLQRENAPLRAVLNGQLVSMPETLYDGFIEAEIAAEGDVFQEAMIIGRVLGKYRLGIGDAWVAHRIEKMICRGILKPAGEAPKDSPVYHRKLQKCKNLYS